MNKTLILMAFILVAGSLHGENLHNLKTGSMPCFQNDDWIEIGSTSFFDLQLGDVICYRPSDDKIAGFEKYANFSPLGRGYHQVLNGNANKICHRIVYKDSYSVIVKADTVNFPDPFRIDSGDYYGKVTNNGCRKNEA